MPEEYPNSKQIKYAHWHGIEKAMMRGYAGWMIKQTLLWLQGSNQIAGNISNQRRHIQVDVSPQALE